VRVHFACASSWLGKLSDTAVTATAWSPNSSAQTRRSSVLSTPAENATSVLPRSRQMARSRAYLAANSGVSADSGSDAPESLKSLAL
jgi:hypothetical protein